MEAADDAWQSAFARAVRHAKGTVSIVDRHALCFERVWCSYAVSVTLEQIDHDERTLSAASGSAARTWDLVTAHTWTSSGYNRSQYEAVTITDGLSAVQPDADRKCALQAHFPRLLLERALESCCAAVYAPCSDDTERLLPAIGVCGNGARCKWLDEVVHGVIASAALRQALEAQDVARRCRYVDALRRGHVRKLHLDLMGSAADTAETWREVVAALDAQTVTEIAFQTGMRCLPDDWTFARLSVLRTVDLSGCSSLVALPERLFCGCEGLVSVKLRGCDALIALPNDLLSGCDALATVNLCGCGALDAVAPSVFSGCSALTVVDLRDCEAGRSRKLVKSLRTRGVKVKR